jgi:hypothetical protein
MNLLKPDYFPNDPYGWLTNQCGHVLLGVVLYTIANASLFFIMGEFPDRFLIWSIVIACYLVWEFAIQRGGHFWDSVEDTLFTAGYGAGSLALMFKEIDAGSPYYKASIIDVLPLIALFAFHCVIGVILRLRGAKSE